jgi:hypothetical protein
VLYLLGGVGVVADIPNARVANTQQEKLVQNLLSIGAQHIYSSLTDCDRLMFLSKEKIACNTMDDHMHPTGSRDPAPGVLVAADAQAVFVFPIDSRQAHFCEHYFARSQSYRRFVFGQYVIFQPIPLGKDL